MNFYQLIENSYLFIAVLGSSLFLIQFIITMFGLGGESGDGDFSVDAHDIADIQGLNFFSLKSIVAFFTFYGWGGVCFSHLNWGGFVLAILCGAIMMILTTLIISLLLKMQQSGNITSNDLIGKHGVVYLKIPPKQGIGGQVTVIFPDRTRVVSARSEVEIETGTSVVITASLGNGVYMVKPIN